jgi:hypothetical protein
MSELNDLIHTNAHNAFGIGVRTEQERIIKLLEEFGWVDMRADDLVALIKGEQK